MKKKYAILLLIIYVISMLIPLNITVLAFADEVNNKYDNTYVMDDLKESKVNGQLFDINKYPVDFGSDKNIELITLVEYCYSEKINKNYGIYIYLYNPSLINIDIKSDKNKIQIKVNDTYEKYELKYLSKSHEIDYRNAFYKFKIEDSNSEIFNSLNSELRNYDVSGIELLEYGNENATEYNVSKQYQYSGYTRGYGIDNEESSLKCKVNELETIKINVKDTYYRTDTSYLGKGHQNQVNTVYFALDNEYFEKYGNLQKIKAEWYEYKTVPIIVTSDNECYNELNVVGKRNIDSYNSNIVYSLGSNPTSVENIKTYNYGYNLGWEPSLLYNAAFCSTNLYLLPLIYYVNNLSVNIDSKTILNDINTYSVAILDEVDSNRIRGYNCLNIDANDTFNLLSYESNDPSIFDKLRDFGFKFLGYKLDDEYYNISPICKISANDRLLNDSLFSTNMLINENDVSEVKNFYDESLVNNQSVILFRFANTDYYTESVDIYKNKKLDSSDKAYLAQTTVFKDFDIIELTFNREGEYTVIPVISDPIDIAADLTEPLKATWNNFFDNINGILKYIGIILAILLFIALFPIIQFVIKFIIKIILYPFKCIKSKINQKNNQIYRKYKR